MTLLAILIIAVVTDLRETRISNRLIASELILGLAFRIVGAGVAGVVLCAILVPPMPPQITVFKASALK